MKKLTLILLAFVLIASACKKDEEEDPEALNPTAAQKGFSLEYTSTTCPTCGSRGGPLLHQYAKDAPHGVVLAIHVNGSSDPMADNSISYGFSSDRPSGGGIPSFWVGDTKTSTSDQDAMKNLVGSGDAIAGIDIKYTKDGSNMKVETLTKFFKAGSGEYFLSVYILEDGIDGSDTAPAGYKQPGGAPGYIHDFVLRAAANNMVMGEKIVTDPSADKEISKSFTIPLKADWEKKLYAVAVLWKYDQAATIKFGYINSIRK